MKIKKIIDISHPIHPGMALWPGDEGITVTTMESIDQGDACNLSGVSFGLHIGTHADAPSHFIKGGKTTSELDLGRFTGMVKVFCVRAITITAENLKGLPISPGDAVFLKTDNSLLPDGASFNKEYTHLDEGAARYLADAGIRTLGVDYMSVDCFESRDYPVHRMLLSRDIGILENLNLRDVAEGGYFFSALPLSMEGVEASPVRAVLIEFETMDFA